MNRLLAPAATAALAAGLLATALTGVAGAATAAPGADAPVASPTSTTTAPAKDRGIVVQIPRSTPATTTLARCFPVGTVFSVSLYENPSTGYGWSQSAPTGATGPVTLLDSDYVQDPAAPGMVGVGGTRYFRYRVTAPGTTDITMLYRRPWETGVPPLQQVTLTIRGR